MKQLLSYACLLITLAGSAQNKVGIFEYGNPSLPEIPPGTSPQDALSYRLTREDIVFNNEEDHLYISSHNDSWFFKQHPEKQYLIGWNLFSQQKENLDPAKLANSRNGRSILALFTPSIKLPAYRNEKKERNGWQTEIWISSDLKVKIGPDYNLSILDTNNNKTAGFSLPNPVNDYKEDRFKYSKEKPKDFDVDLQFDYYAKGNLLYIRAAWGLTNTNDAERIWQYNLSNNTLTEIPLISRNAKEINYSTETTFCNDYLVRKSPANFDFLEIISLSDGKLMARIQEGLKGAIDYNHPVPKNILTFLPKTEEVVGYDGGQINFYDKNLQFTHSITLDLGKGDPYTSLALVSKSNKFFAFLARYTHPEIGKYHSLNYTLLDDVRQGYFTSLNDDKIHAPLIKEDYATQNNARVKAQLEVKQKELNELIAHRDLLKESIKKVNDKLLPFYNAGNFATLLETGDTWTTENGEYSWESGQTNMLNTATKYRFSVTYAINFRSATASSGNYVSMTCKEHTEAHQDFKLIAQEDKMYGESYVKPAKSSHTLARNPNYRFGNAYINFDKGDARTFLPYLEKYTDLFNGNSFEIIQQQQAGVPVIVLKYPSRAAGKFIYVYQFEIFSFLKNYIDDTKQIEKLAAEMKKMGN